jgi:hypothetical protein
VRAGWRRSCGWSSSTRAIRSCWARAANRAKLLQKYGINEITTSCWKRRSPAGQYRARRRRSAAAAGQVPAPFRSRCPCWRKTRTFQTGKKQINDPKRSWRKSSARRLPRRRQALRQEGPAEAEPDAAAADRQAEIRDREEQGAGEKGHHRRAVERRQGRHRGQGTRTRPRSSKSSIYITRPRRSGRPRHRHGPRPRYMRRSPIARRPLKGSTPTAHRSNRRTGPDGGVHRYQTRAWEAVRHRTCTKAHWMRHSVPHRRLGRCNGPRASALHQRARRNVRL